MKIKILTLNIWRYYNWDKRKKDLINFLKEQDADIVLIQEGAYDERLKDKFKNQIDEINKELGYEHHLFSPMAKMTKWHERPIDWEMWYGLGILSKFSIKKSIFTLLPHVDKEKDFGFLHASLDVNGKSIDVINVHFENTDNGSKKHLQYLLKWCQKNNVEPIIAGDFNMKDTDSLFNIADEKFGISYKISPYISFMPTEFSNNEKPITLDYIIASKKRFSISKVECKATSISDHRPVIAEIEVLST